MKLLEEYLRNAEECRKLAAKADQPEQRAAIERIAETWKQLAELRRKTLQRPG